MFSCFLLQIFTITAKPKSQVFVQISFCVQFIATLIQPTLLAQESWLNTTVCFENIKISAVHILCIFTSLETNFCSLPIFTSSSLHECLLSTSPSTLVLLNIHLVKKSYEGFITPIHDISDHSLTDQVLHVTHRGFSKPGFGLLLRDQQC